MARFKQPTSFRFSEEAKEMLARLTAYRGGSQATVIEQLIREAFHANEPAIERWEKKVEARSGKGEKKT